MDLNLPELCYSVEKNTGKLIVIKRGEKGYYNTNYNTENADSNRACADFQNEKLGVTVVQRAAMEAGSMFGWNTPAANPKNYDKYGKPKNKEKAKKDFGRSR